jgi:hypothetical protein
MGLIIKKKAAYIFGVGLLLAVCIDASAVPFFAKQNRSSLAQTQADTGTGGSDALVTGYTQDVQSGVSDFQFLARNFSGSDTRPALTTSGVLDTSVLATNTIAVPAPIPGSLSLVGLGAALLFWRKRK